LLSGGEPCLFLFSSWAPHEKHKLQSRTSRGQSSPIRTSCDTCINSLSLSEFSLWNKVKMGLMCLTQLWRRWMRLFRDQPHQSPLFHLCLHWGTHTHTHTHTVILAWPADTPPPLFAHQFSQWSEWFLLVFLLLSTGSCGDRMGLELQATASCLKYSPARTRGAAQQS
jgi:hypothetical protein